MIDFYAASAAIQSKDNQAKIQKKVDKVEQCILNYGRLHVDGELNEKQYQALYNQAENELRDLRCQVDKLSQEQANSPAFHDIGKIKKALYQVIDVSGPRISDELIEEFVETITPVENNFFGGNLILVMHYPAEIIAIWEVYRIVHFLLLPSTLRTQKATDRKTRCPHNFAGSLGTTSKWKYISSKKQAHRLLKRCAWLYLDRVAKALLVTLHGAL